MWHLRTKHGIFWLVENQEKEYFLGIDDINLGVYKDIDSAINDISEQNTGYFKWDSQSRVIVPKQISQWSAGEPEEWLEQA